MQRREFTLAMAAAMKANRFDEAAALMRKAVDAGTVRAASLYISDEGRRSRVGVGEVSRGGRDFPDRIDHQPMTAAGVMTLADRARLVSTIRSAFVSNSPRATGGAYDPASADSHRACRHAA
jgi:hypothetical protein